MDITRAYDCEKASPASLNCAGLPTGVRIVRDFGIDSEAFILHCLYRPLLKRIVGGVDPVPPRWRTNIRAEEDPCVCAPDKVRATVDVWFHSQKSKFMTAEGHKQAIPLRPARSQRPHSFQHAH